MSGAVAFFGFIIFFVLVLLGGMDYSQEIIIDDNTFEATRTTQLNTLTDGINIGDLIVNGEVSIDEEVAVSLWQAYFEENNDINKKYQVEYIEVHPNPAAIAVKLKVTRSMHSVDEISTSEYFNLIIVDDKRSE